jgi:myosin heavy subunit
VRAGIVLSILALFGIVAATYFYMESRKKNAEVKQLQEEKVDLESEVSELNERVQSLSQELERKDMELKEKSDKVEALSKEIQQLRARITKYAEEGKISQRQFEEMKLKTEQMAYYIQKYQARIQELEEENKMLREKTAQLYQEVQKKEEETEQVKQEKERLEVKVRAASYLKAAEFRFALVKDNGKKEDWDTEFRARRIERLKICFTVLENEVAEPGPRTAYIVISDPSGKVITNFSASSGYFTMMDTEQPYSAKVEFSYQRQRQEVCGLFQRDKSMDLEKGTYRAAVFCEGVEIGRSTFQVK